MESLLEFATGPELKRIQELLTGRQASTVTATLVPTARQAEFLALECEEALYGGAAGGGKSEALLMWLAEGIDVPGYTGLIFRRTYPQLIKSNDGLIAKSRRLFRQLGGSWNGSEKQWRFPSGAMIEMGHLPYEKSVDDYQGPSYHRIAFDELTQFSETQYTYLFSRIRRVVDFPISLGMRAASNPGGEGHFWVRRRFVPNEAIAAIKELDPQSPSPAGMIFWPASSRAFVPARLADNRFLDQADYESKLSHLSPVTRERLKRGDWGITEDSQIKAEWLRYYTMQGEYYRLQRADGSELAHFTPKECQRFITVDSAGTSEDVAREKRGKPPSRTAISTWDWHRKHGWLIWRGLRLGRWGINDQIAQCRAAYDEARPDWLGIEIPRGQDLLELLGPISKRPLSHESKGKLERAGRALNLMEQGKLFLPLLEPWRDAIESELLAWDGNPDTPYDIGDTLTYAAIHAGRSNGGTTVIGRGGLLGGRI